MKLGVSTYAYSWGIGISEQTPETPMDVFEFLKTAANLGVHLVQIADNLPMHLLTDRERSSLWELAKKLKIDIEVGTRGIKSNNLETYLEIARQFNSPILRVVIDTPEHQPESQEIIETIIGLLPKLKTANVTLAIENHDRFKSSLLAEMIKACNSPLVGICLDTVNSFGAQEGTEMVVENLGPYTVNLHIKDYLIERIPSKLGFLVTGTPAGDGMLNVPWILNRLNLLNRKFNGILELWMAPEDNIDKTLSKEQAWVKKSVSYLKNYIPS